MTTAPNPNWRIRPLQYQQGARVVTIVRSIAGLASGVAKSADFSMYGRIAILHTAIVTGADQATLHIENRRANRQAALSEALASLRHGDRKHSSTDRLDPHFAPRVYTNSQREFVFVAMGSKMWTFFPV